MCVCVDTCLIIQRSKYVLNISNHILCIEDGLLLMAMEDNDLMKNLGIENSLHRRALMLALNQVRERGVKPPTNLWEYKVSHLT